MREETDDALFSEEVEKFASNRSPKEKKKLAESLRRVFAEGISFSEALGVSPNTMEYLYSYGHRCYSLRKYESAARIFLELYLLNPYDPRYALGIAAAYQMAKDYEKAVGWYLTLSVIDKQSPLPFYYLSDCYVKTHEPVIAKAFLEKALERCGDNPEYSLLRERSARMILGLEGEIKKEALKASKVEASTYDN